MESCDRLLAVNGKINFYFMLELKATPREEFGKKVNKKRKTGQIPAVIYGHGIKSEALYVPSGDFSKIHKEAGASSMVGLDIGGKKKNVLIHDISRDPLSDEIIHIDFYQVRMDEKIKAKVPLVFIGESEAVKAEGGVLVKNIQEIEVEALPSDLPHHINVDISSLKSFKDHIYIKDLSFDDKKVKIFIDTEEIVALVTPPRSEEELAALEQKVEASVEEIKVVGKEEKAQEEILPEQADEKK